MTEKSGEQKGFDLTLSRLGRPTRSIYDQLLLEKQIELAKENKGKPVTISVEEREKILSRARQVAQYGNADPKRMAGDWDYRNQRPPIGGAQDD